MVSKEKAANKVKGRVKGKAKQQGQGGQQQAQNGQGQNGQGGGQRQGGQTGDRFGETRNGGGTNRSTVYGDFDTGGQHFTVHAVPQQQGPNPADTQKEIDQGLNALNQLRPAVQDSPEARQQLQALIDQMRNLDPKRFTGNPALVEQMHQQLVSQVDALELQLRRQLDEKQGGNIRNTDPTKVPAGYQNSVAEYYREASPEEPSSPHPLDIQIANIQRAAPSQLARNERW